MHRLPSDSLANCCLNHSANFPYLVENTGIEPVVPEGGGFTVHCITIDASSPNFGGGNRIRTRRLDLAKVLLYQMSYTPKNFTLGSRTRIELVIAESQPAVLPLN